jgi:hypothetical protein
MPRLTRLASFRTTAVTATAGALALAGVIATAGPASATTGTGTDTKIKATYPVTGSTFLKAPNFTLPVGPGTLASTVNVITGKLTANLSLPPATGSFKQFGIIPVTATAQFINAAPTTGKINLKTGAVHSTSKITLQITNLTVAGLPVPVGPSCETSTPAVVSVASQPGFSILKGGNLAGSYTIPQFANCLLATPLINLTIPGPGNTLTLTLGKPTFGG